MTQLAHPGRLMMNPRKVGAAASWSPTDLGAALLGWLVADDLTPGAVASWVDRVAAYDFTGAGAEQPTASATSYNGAPGVTFDGVGNFLTLASQPFPSGANVSNMLAVVDQTALVADTTSRMIVSYGGDTGGVQRRLQRRVITGANVLTASVSATVSDAPGNFSGRHYCRQLSTGTTTTGFLDGVAGSGAAVVPATGTSRVRIGATASTVAANFFQGVIREIIITGALTAGQVTSLNAYLAGRA